MAASPVRRVQDFGRTLTGLLFPSTAAVPSVAVSSSEMSAPAVAAPVTPPRAEPADGGAASTSAAAASDALDPLQDVWDFVLMEMNPRHLTVSPSGWVTMGPLDAVPMEPLLIGEKGARADSKFWTPRAAHVALNPSTLFLPCLAAVAAYVWVFVMTHGVFPGAFEEAFLPATLLYLNTARTGVHSDFPPPASARRGPLVGKALFAVILWAWARLPRDELAVLGLTLPPLLALIPG